MPAPTDFAEQSGRFVVYFARTPADPFAKDDRWVARSVQIGSRDRPSTAEIDFDRTRYLEDGAGIQRPHVSQDSRFAVAWNEPGQNGGTLLFDGFMATHPRDDIGTVGASRSSESINPIDAADTWAHDIASQITGAHFARIPQIGEGKIVLDTSMPCVFNPEGLANRSVETAENTGAFDLNPQPKAHYFVSPDGFDYATSEDNVTAFKARYWTFAQAIAYLLWWWCDATDANPVVRNGVSMSFGSDLDQPNSSDDLIRSTVTPHLQTEVPGEIYEGEQGPPEPAPTAFEVSPERLLSAKVPGIDVTGMNVLDALRVLCEEAGLGFWIDCKQAFGNIDSPPTPIKHFVRVWTPGGILNSGNNGIGQIFLPRLDPHNAPQSSLLSATFIADHNSVQAVSVHRDTVGLVNSPVMRRSPSLYEVTIDLRPLWKPIHPSLTMAMNPINAYIDNIDSTVSIEPNVTEEDQAVSDAQAAGYLGTVNAADQLAIDDPDIRKPIAFIAQALNSKGKYGSEYYDVLRKWGIPTDMRYPNNVYARGGGAPLDFLDYLPVDFSDPNGPLLNPITAAETGAEDSNGAEMWPHRARPFLPLLVEDPGGQTPDTIVEISFDGGNRYYQFDAVTTSPSESALWLNFTTPFDVVPPEADDPEDINTNNESSLIIAYIKHKFRVRITCAIEGSDLTTTLQAFPLVSSDLLRSRAFLRPQYGRTAIASKHKGMTTPAQNSISDPNDNDLLEDDMRKRWIFRPADDTPAMRGEADRIRAYYGDFKASGNLSAYYIDLDVTPGMVIPRIHEPAPGTGEIPREYEFETVTDNNVRLAPHVVGVVYTMTTGNLSTTIMLEDWRSIVALAGASV